jgi:molybdopterin molybdotransferase
MGGKPTWFSKSGKQLVLGLPGNPAAAMVTAQLFLRPLIDALMSASPAPGLVQRAHTSEALPATGNREEYLRSVLTIGADGRASVMAAENQDSSLLSPFLTANALIRRPAQSPAAAAGDLVGIVLLK